MSSAPHRIDAPADSAAEDVSTEHILLESGEEHDPAPAARTIAQRHWLNDRLHRVSTELTLFEEGFLTLRSHRAGRLQRHQQFDLRWLDPSPLVKRHVPARTLRAALVLAGVGLLGSLAAAWPPARPFGAICAALAAIGAILALLIAAYRTREDSVYVTRHGRAEALRLRATFGCLRSARAIIPEISAQVRQANLDVSPDKPTRLRQEMREHYRLQKEGIISREACSQGTARLLALFD